MNFKDLEQTMDYLLKGGITPNLVGHHGVGKTEFIRQYAQKNGYELMEFRLGTTSDAGDLVGVPHIHEIKDLNTFTTMFATPDFFPRSGKWILFFDEWNRCQVKEIYQALFNLILEGKMNQYSLPEGSKVILACNPDTDDYDVFNFDDAAFRDRICRLEVKPSTEEYLEYNTKKYPTSTILDFLKAYPEMRSTKLEEFKAPEVKYSGRTMSRLMALETQFNPPENILRTIMMGMVGISATQLYFKHKETEVSLKGKDIINNFPKHEKRIAKLSADNKLDIINHIVDDIVREFEGLEANKKRLTEKQEENVINFVLTIPKDFGYAFIKEKLRYARVAYPEVITDKNAKCLAYDGRIIEHFKKYKKKEKAS